MIGRWRGHPWVLRAAALLVSAVVACLPAKWAPEMVSIAEGVVGDAFWRLGASSTPERRIVVVDIDEKSLGQIGPWPWPRATLADLSDRLVRAGAVVQAYDITFATAKEGDAALAQAWARSPTVAAQLFSIDPAVTPSAGQAVGALAAGACPKFAPQAYGLYGLADGLAAAHPATGHITPRVELDGVVRTLPALVCYQGRAYATLAMAALWRAAQPPASADAGAPVAPDWQWQGPQDETRAWAGWLSPAGWLTSKSLPGVVVPVDTQGNLRVPYNLTRSSFAAVSAAAVLDGSADLGLLKGAVVMVGATAFGIGDIVATPHRPVASGLEVHAQTLVGLLDNRLPSTPLAWPGLQAATMVLLGFGLTVLTNRRLSVPAKRLPLTGLFLAGACVAGAGVALLRYDVWLPWLTPALFVVLASVSLATVEHAFARAQRERLSAHLGAYLPQPVAQRLMASDPSGLLQIERREVSVLVADIRNFSAFVTHCPPEEAAALLHAFCCIAVEVVERHGGVVENVVGDSILAVWNASADSADHPARALAAARDLLRATEPLLASSRPVADDSPLQPLALGIGMEAGAAIVGSFGPTRRRAHAALGEPVSVANRIQQMTADLSVPILVGPHLAAQLPSAGVEALGEYLLEGLGKHYQLFVPAGWTELVSVDPNWASSAAAASAERQADAPDWSRWSEPAKTRALRRGELRVQPALTRRRA